MGYRGEGVQISPGRPACLWGTAVFAICLWFAPRQLSRSPILFQFKREHFPGLWRAFHPHAFNTAFLRLHWIVLIRSLTHLFSPAPNHVYFLKVSRPLILFFFFFFFTWMLKTFLPAGYNSMTLLVGFGKGRALHLSARIAICKSHWSLCPWFSSSRLTKMFSKD